MNSNEKILTILRSQLDYFVDYAQKEKDYVSQCAFFHSAFGAVLYAQRLAVSESDFDFAQDLGRLWMDEYLPTFESMGVA